MEVQDQESVGRWDRLGSRDPSSRADAIENICQEVMRKVETIGPIPPVAPLSLASGSPPGNDLNDILAHVLMLSRRCPFEDVRERCSQLLRNIQVRESRFYDGELCCITLHPTVICLLEPVFIVLICSHLPLFTSS